MRPKLLTLAHKNFSEIQDIKGGGIIFQSWGGGKKEGEAKFFQSLRGGNQSLQHYAHYFFIHFPFSSSEIASSQSSLTDENKGKYFCVYYPDNRYWGRLEKVFYTDVDDEKAAQAEFKFLHYSCGYWDFPKTGDDVDPKTIDVEYVFMGPCTPAEIKQNGYKFLEDAQAIQIHKTLKRDIKRFKA